MSGIINYNQILGSRASKNETKNEFEVLNQGLKIVLDFWYAWNHFKFKYAEF